MSDMHVTAWNYVDERGTPILEVNRDMTREEFSNESWGQYACVSATLLYPISREEIERRLAEQTDEEIEAAIADDPDAAPILNEEWFKEATLVTPKQKQE